MSHLRHHCCCLRIIVVGRRSSVVGRRSSVVVHHPSSVVKVIGLVHNKQLLDEVFVISGIIKVEVSVISWNRRLRLITLTENNNHRNHCHRLSSRRHRHLHHFSPYAQTLSSLFIIVVDISMEKMAVRSRLHKIQGMQQYAARCLQKVSVVWCTCT